jgi:hypothetical protein
MPASPKWTLSLRFSHQKPVYSSGVSHTLSMPRLTQWSWFQNRNNIWWSIKTTKLFVMKLPPLTFYHVPHKPKYFLQHPNFKHPQPMFLPQYERPSFTPKKNRKENYNFVCLNV